MVWDELRKCYLVLTPEEWVRRHVIGFLTSHLNIQPAQIVQEYPVIISDQNQRADIVVIDRNGAPIFMVECKAPEVKINQSTLDQAVRYNSVLEARYLLLTNGVTHHLYERKDSEGGYRTLNSFEEIVLLLL